MAATSRFWQWRITANPLQCCLPDPAPEFCYEQLPDSVINAAEPPSTSSPAPQTSDQSPEPDVDAGIHELIASINDLDGADSQFENLRSLELNNPPPSLPLHIDPKSRAYCVDCVIDAAEKLRSKRSTLHLAVSYFDRYLSRNDVVIADLRLVGLACLLVAASRSDGGVRDRSQLDWYSRRLCQGTIRRGDLVRTAASVLRTLGHEAAAVTAWSFLKKFVGGGGGEAELKSMSSYIAEVSLLSSEMLRFSPSMVAASSVFLAQYVLEPARKKPWEGAMYRPSDLRECVAALHECCYGRRSYYLPAVTIKYSKKKYAYVALRSAPRSIPPENFEDSET